ncbi:uncharacterized protein [Panulirus ornatus]|uniref:uncharacterized protein n=1 Tax=Panulirus ornatus TaxID=150431 RepID=UPI003A8B7CF1
MDTLLKLARNYPALPLASGAGAPSPAADPPDTPLGDDLDLDTPQTDARRLEDLANVLRREGRHFSTFDVCGDTLCDQIVRQANGLARIKMVRKYIMDTVGIMDSLVTALDAELVVAGETLTRALGNRCRAAHAVLWHVTKGPMNSDRLNTKGSSFIYGGGIPNRT